MDSQSRKTRHSAVSARHSVMEEEGCESPKPPSLSRRKSQISSQANDATMAIDFLANLVPPLRESTMAKIRAVLPEHSVSISVLAALKVKGVRDLLQLEGVQGQVDAGRICAAIGTDLMETFAPPPLGPHGEPVVVRPKVGFTQLTQVDTVNQTVWARFFVDMYWHDPRMIGLDYIPDGLWRPADCYIGNQHGNMERIRHENRPVLIDKKTGLLLWPVEFVGLLSNPMALHKFPFDTDAIDILIHQNEASLGRDEYIFRPWPPAEEQQSVRFFFGVHDDLTEFDVVGFSKECYESVGGIPTEFSKCSITLHVVRRWPYYFWKIALPIFLCTIFCFSALFFPVNIETFSEATDDPAQAIFSSQGDMDSLSERNNVAVTMFLASSALLYVVASTLPKTSYLTTMDKFVLVNLFIQFAVAAVSWVSVGVFFKVDNNESRLINLVAFCVLLFVLLTSSVVILGVPMVKSLRRDRKSWPDTLGNEVPEIQFYPFELFVNVYPPWQTGTKNPVKLDDKKYGPGVTEEYVMGSGWGAKPASSGHPLAGGGGDDGDERRPVDAQGIKMKVDTRANQKKVPSKLLLEKKTGSVVAADV